MMLQCRHLLDIGLVNLNLDCVRLCTILQFSTSHFYTYYLLVLLLKDVRLLVAILGYIETKVDLPLL